MARRRSRTRSKSRKKRSLGRWLLVGGIGLVVMLVAGVFVIYIGLRGYLHSERFRGMLDEQVSTVLKAEGEFEPFHWTGTTAYTDAYAAKGYEDALFSKLKADGIEARVNFGAVRRGVWEIANIDIARVNVLIDGAARVKRPAMFEDPAPEEDGSGEDSSSGDGSSGGGLLSAFIPDTVELKRAGVRELNFDLRLGEAKVAGRQTRLEVRPTATSDVFRVGAHGGTIKAAGYPALELDDAEVRASTGKAIVDHAEFTLFDDAKLDATGDVTFAGAAPDFDIELRARDLAADKVLAEDWVKRLKGTIEADVAITGSAGEGGDLRVSGDVELKGGILEAMPVLDRIDEMLGSSRFRRLSFNEFKVTFERRGPDLTLSDCYALSAGTACLKGHALLADGAEPTGKYMLGITPETIKWLPLLKKAVIEVVFAHDRDAAFAQVFGTGSTIEKPPEGFRWAVARVIPGAPDPYSADLREQFSKAGGLAIWAQLVGISEKGVEALGLLASAAQAQGMDAMAVLSEGAGEGGLFAPENLMRAAGELGVTSSMEKLLGGVIDGVGGIPGALFETGSGFFEGLFR